MKNKKKSKKSIAKKAIKILSRGEIKLSNGDTIDLGDGMMKSIDDTIVSSLDNIISREDVVIESEDISNNIRTFMLPEITVGRYGSLISDAVTRTIVIPVEKGAELDVFDFLNDGPLGDLLRTSTLATIYKGVKKDWKKLCENDDSSLTNVLFIPKVMVFLDNNTGKILNHTFNVNVLIVASPRVATLISELKKGDEHSVEMLYKRIINDVVESSVVCGCKDIIINPYIDRLGYTVPITTDLWMRFLSSQTVRDNFNSLSFSITNENLFISFEAQLYKIKE